MAYLRKTLGSADASYVRSLMALMETQSKATLIRWCVCYARANILPIYEQAYPCDGRPRQSLDAAEAWLAGAIRFPMARKLILQAHAAAREASDHPGSPGCSARCGPGRILHSRPLPCPWSCLLRRGSSRL